MGIVDRKFFSALTGRSFASDWQAIRYYLIHENDAALGLSLSPLVEREWLTKQIVDTDSSWYSVLLKSPGFLSTSPYFDSRVYSEALAGSPRPKDTRDALRHFMRHAGPDTLMPVAQGRRGPAITWQGCQSQAISDARLFAEQQGRQPIFLKSWDTKTERRFLQGIADGRIQTESQPLVSIVIFANGNVRLLKEALHSVHTQTHKNWEVLVISDKQNDEVDEFLIAASTDGRRITHMFQEGLGGSVIRNCALAGSSGEFVAFLYAENSSWLPRYLEYSLDGLKERSARVAHCGMRIVRDHGDVEFSGGKLDRDDLLAGNVVNLSSVVVSRGAVEKAGGFDESIEHCFDYDLLLRLSEFTPLEYLPFLGVECTERHEADGAAAPWSSAWGDVVLEKHLIDWVALERASSTRRSRLVSVVIPTYTDWEMTATAVRAVLDNSGSTSIEVIVIDNGSRRHVFAILRALFGSEPKVRVLRVARNFNFALSNNFGLAVSHGEYVVSLNNDTKVTDGWLEPLLLPLEQDDAVIGTQPLLLYPDGRVQSAGTVFLGEGKLPEHFLSGRPVADALIVTERDYTAVTAATLCMRANELIALRGFDPLYTNGLEDVDLCLRAKRRRSGVFRVVNESVVYHYEGQSPGRSRAAKRNRALFAARWEGMYPPSDEWRYGSGQSTWPKLEGTKDSPENPFSSSDRTG